MRTALWITALASALPLMVPGCAAKTNGELMLAIQTDMALPKDIDRIRIEVVRVSTGAPAFQKDFIKFEGEEAIKLPATLGFLTPKDPSEAIRVRVIASRGEDSPDAVKVLREAVTTVPTDRTVMLPLTLEFLCEGSGAAEVDDRGNIKRDPSGNVIFKSNCPEGLTCVAGVCVTKDVPAATLLDYTDANIFGGGTGSGDGACFDTATCFDEGTDAPVDLAAFAMDKTTCLATAGGEINVGLRTQGSGICGKNGCFVALNAGSDAGFQPGPDGKIKLPVKVCQKLAESQNPMAGSPPPGSEDSFGGKIVGVVTAPIGKGTCQKKQLSLPTCGPWSATGQDLWMPPDAKKPTLLASGQKNPFSIAVAPGSVYWTEAGSFDENGEPKSDGAVKVISLNGGEPGVIAERQTSPHGLALDIRRQFILWANAGSKATGGKGAIFVVPFPNLMTAKESNLMPMPLLEGLSQPEGIVLAGPTLYWTESASNTAYKIDTMVIGPDLKPAMNNEPAPLPSPMGPALKAPRGIAAAPEGACWTYEAMLNTSGGVVACSFAGMMPISTNERTPRAIALSADGSGRVTGVYWANFDAASTGGGIFMVPITRASDVPQIGARAQFASEEYPAGLILDGDTLYWTSRSRGAVMRQKLGDTKPTVVAEGQVNPGAIAVDKDTVYWLNEGVIDATGKAAPNGAVMKVLKN